MESAIKSLSHLQSATLRLEDSQLHLTATARLPDDAQAARAALPAGYDSQVEIEVLDDGQPFALSVQLSQGQLTGHRKISDGRIAANCTGRHWQASAGRCALNRRELTMPTASLPKPCGPL
jgi:hypothetical protein